MGIPSESAAISSPSGGGFGTGHVVESDDHFDQLPEPVALERLLDAVSVLGRHHPDPSAGVVQRPERRRGSRQEGRAGEHHLVRLADVMLEELFLPRPPFLARQHPERRVEIEPDGPPDGVRRGRREPQAAERVVHADHDALRGIRQREVEVEEDGAGGRHGTVDMPAHSNQSRFLLRPFAVVIPIRYQRVPECSERTLPRRVPLFRAENAPPGSRGKV